MKLRHITPFAFLLVVSFSCVKKVTPSMEAAYYDLRSTNTYLFPYQDNGSSCKGISLDGDTTEDFRICAYYYGGGQSRQSIYSAVALHGVVLELGGVVTQGAQCNPNTQALKFRRPGETVITADTSNINTSVPYDYYLGAGAQGIAIQGNCRYSSVPSDSVSYIVLRRKEGADLSIGYLEVINKKITRFRKFQKENQVVLP